MPSRKKSAQGYRNNHYVPVWYQKRFVPADQVDQELYYLDLKPKPFLDPNGVTRPIRNPRRQGYRFCFAERDLYTAQIGGLESTEIEQTFFGAIDREGLKAVDHYASFAHPWNGTKLLDEMLVYMSTQKLRTPKGLGWLKQQADASDKTAVLGLMMQLRQLYCAIWTECVWLVADASRSDTKFIVSDHPVTVYNRRCGPRSQWCRGFNDPDIAFHATHTLFPLSLDKILVLTNVSWVRNPYQSEMESRPNPYPFRPAIFKFTDIQTLRYLAEEEVLEINFILKSRAHRYIGAAREEWLYPERHVTKANWYAYGHGYLLMPDPRSVTYSKQVIMGYRDGTSMAYDEYGRPPWHPDYSGDRDGPDKDWFTFLRFQGEFAKLFGPRRRGRAFNGGLLDNEQDSDEFHNYHLGLAKQRGKGARRRNQGKKRP